MDIKKQLPDLYLIKNRFPCHGAVDISSKIKSELSGLKLSRKISAGETVAIAVGSRWITGLKDIVKSTVEELRSTGAEPFIVPAMGSHGGATPEGQAGILSGFGIDEESIGCAIRPDMDVILLGTTNKKIPVFMNRHACEAGHTVIINRIKPHTLFSGDIESGLMKMCMIGLGNREGASAQHMAAERSNWMDLVRSAHGFLMKKSNILFGIGIVENAEKKTACIKAVLFENFIDGEKALLRNAKKIAPFIPFDDIDLLIVDEMGKDISGTGMDVNVTGRKTGSGKRINKIYARDLSSKTAGNAHGIGLADFTTRRLVEKIDFNAMYLNSRTAFRTDACKIPMTFDSDSEAMAAAMQMTGSKSPDAVRLVWIKNTLDLGMFYVSKSLLDEITSKSVSSVISGPHAVNFDNSGNFIPLSLKF
ncbi:MAG: nickel-dependent lactate racemase [Spirochaetes bacterium]|nr:nickel-dependent lactate racemase [Spirochaetota bacterium]